MPASRPSASRSATSTRSSTAGYHRELLATGAFAVYDQAFRWGDARQRHAPAARVRRSTTATPARSCSGWTPHGRATTGRSVDRPASPTCCTTFSDQLEARGLGAGDPAAVLRRESGSRVRIRGGRSMSHEPLLTSVVGSHAHPGWFVAGIAAAERGEFGPADLAEMLDDAVDLAIRDQEEAGIDVITRRRDAPGRLLHRRVLSPPDRRPAAARPIAGSVPGATTSSIASRSSSRSPRPTASASSRSTRLRARADDAAAQGDACRGRTRCRAG